MTEKDRMSDRSIKNYFIDQSEMFIQNGPIWTLLNDARLKDGTMPKSSNRFNNGTI